MFDNPKLDVVELKLALLVVKMILDDYTAVVGVKVVDATMLVVAVLVVSVALDVTVLVPLLEMLLTKIVGSKVVLERELVLFNAVLYEVKTVELDVVVDKSNYDDDTLAELVMVLLLDELLLNIP